MRIHNLYTDASGQSHFRDIEVEWIEERRGSKLSKTLAGDRHHFSRNPGRARHRLGTRRHAANTLSISTRA